MSNEFTPFSSRGERKFSKDRAGGQNAGHCQGSGTSNQFEFHANMAQKYKHGFIIDYSVQLLSLPPAELSKNNVGG